MKIKTFISILILLSLLVSCKTIKPSRTDTQVHRDTTIINKIVTIRDTVFRLEPDKSALVALLQCDSTSKVVISGLISEITGLRNAKLPNISINDNILVAECECDTASIRLPLIEYYTQEISRIENQQQEKIIEIEKVHIRGFFWWTGLIAIALIVIYVAYKLFKKFYILKWKI